MSALRRAHAGAHHIFLLAAGGTLCATLIAVFYFVVLFDGAHREGSWNHFTRGGMFYTTPPSLSPDLSVVAYATTSRGCGDIAILDLTMDGTKCFGDPTRVETAPHLVYRGETSTIVFLKEDKRQRHLWSVDPSTGHTTQLTNGCEWDYIIGIDPDCRRVLVLRAGVASGGLGREGVWCFDLQGKADSFQVGAMACFTQAGIVFQTDGDPNSVLLRDDNGAVQVLTEGHLVGTGMGGSMVVVSDRRISETGIDHPLSGCSVMTGGRRHLCIGHSLVAFADGSLIFRRGFGGTVIFKDVDGQESTVEVPDGVADLYEHQPSGSALIYQRSQNGSKGAVWRFDRANRTFRKIVEIP